MILGKLVTILSSWPSVQYDGRDCFGASSLAMIRGKCPTVTTTKVAQSYDKASSYPETSLTPSLGELDSSAEIVANLY